MREYSNECCTRALFMKISTPSRPNILLLTADQQRYDTIGAVNAPFMLTPNLDRLVNEGCVWRRAYTPNPICVSARHNILTGLPARYHGMPHNAHRPLPLTVPTLPRILGANGYTTAAIGKMHFYPVRAHHGFNTMRLMEEIPTHVEDDEYLQYLRSVGLDQLLQIHGSRVLGYQLPQRSIMPEKHHGSTWVARETCRFIESNQNRPWFAWARWIAPHPPANVPDTFADLYSGVALPEIRGLEGEERPEARRFRELYYAAISLVDKGIGMVLDKLDQLGLADNTLVIYCSDHGEMLGDLGLMQKQLPYEGSVRVPLIVRFPGRIQPGTNRDAFADLNDILPTALDAADINVSEVACRHNLEHGFPGDSLLRLHSLKDRSIQYCEFGDLTESQAPRWIMIRNDQWKYIHWFGGGLDSLFDLSHDPYELCNLINNPAEEVQHAYRKLREHALQYELVWGLKGAVCNGEFIAIPFRTNIEAHRMVVPRWSLSQWPAFPGSYSSTHIDQLKREFDKVIKNEPLGADARVQLEDLERSEWWRHWEERGGDMDSFRRIFYCSPPPSAVNANASERHPQNQIACSSI